MTTGDNMSSFGENDVVGNGAFDTGMRTTIPSTLQQQPRVGDPFYLSGPSTAPTGRLLDTNNTGSMGGSGIWDDL